MRHELLLFAPVVLILVWHFGVAAHYGPPADLATAFQSWGTLRGKLLALTRNFNRYGGRLDAFLLFLYVASLVLLICTRVRSGALASPRVVESLALAAAFFGMYMALPFLLGDATYVDLRALAPATLFLLLACLHLSRAERLPNRLRGPPSLALMLAIVLSVLNLGYLERHFAALSSWSMKVRTLFAFIPRGAHVLPVQTQPAIWRYIDPTAIVVIDRQAWIPYLFSADTGAPQVYFRYVDRRYAPPDDWYIRASSGSVDWRQIACNYRYILVTRPFDPGRLRIATQIVAENSSAELLAIGTHACGP